MSLCSQGRYPRMPWAGEGCGIEGVWYRRGCLAGLYMCPVGVCLGVCTPPPPPPRWLLPRLLRILLECILVTPACLCPGVYVSLLCHFLSLSHVPSGGLYPGASLSRGGSLCDRDLHPPPPPVHLMTATAAGGMHPTGMHSCLMKQEYKS